MKKVLVVLLSLLLVTGSLLVAASADDLSPEEERPTVGASSPEAPTVFVTLLDAEGNFASRNQPFEVTDSDADGSLTISDALFAAHEALFEGGAAAAYGAEIGEYGLSLTKLCGTENGGGYGYYVNNVAAWSLADPIQDGDRVTAFVYTDLTAWSDTFCWFAEGDQSAEAGQSVSLTLQAYAYDENYNMSAAPVSGATILVDDEPTSYTTGEDGKVTLSLTAAGSHWISASSETQNLVAPLCSVEITAASAEQPPKTGDSSLVAVSVALILSAGVLVSFGKKRGVND